MDAKGRGLLARADLAALQTPETFETPFSRTEVDAVLRDLDADGSGGRAVALFFKETTPAV